MSKDRMRLSDEGADHERRDPDAKEIEIDAANDARGGPTTESLSAGAAPGKPAQDRKGAIQK